MHHCWGKTGEPFRHWCPSTLGSIVIDNACNFCQDLILHKKRLLVDIYIPKNPTPPDHSIPKGKYSSKPFRPLWGQFSGGESPIGATDLWGRHQRGGFRVDWANGYKPAVRTGWKIQKCYITGIVCFFEFVSCYSDWSRICMDLMDI